MTSGIRSLLESIPKEKDDLFPLHAFYWHSLFTHILPSITYTPLTKNQDRSIKISERGNKESKPTELQRAAFLPLDTKVYPKFLHYILKLWVKNVRITVVSSNIVLKWSSCMWWLNLILSTWSVWDPPGDWWSTLLGCMGQSQRSDFGYCILSLDPSSLTPFHALFPSHHEQSTFSPPYPSAMIFLLWICQPWTDSPETLSQIKPLPLQAVSFRYYVQ